MGDFAKEHRANLIGQLQMRDNPFEYDKDLSLATPQFSLSTQLGTSPFPNPSQ